MNYVALATDFDGTIAFEGSVAAPTLNQLRRARASGVRLILVTGRELSDLFNTFDESQLFDRIVGENGGVLYDPTSGAIEVLGAAPPPALTEMLTQQNIPFSVGHTIVATVEPYGAQVLDAISSLRIPWHVIPNKEAVMALPANVSKGSGLLRALASLEISADQTIGIGDAENDEALLRACGLAVAVQNALPGLKQIADLVTAGARGDGVIELVERLLAGDLTAVPLRPSGP